MKPLTFGRKFITSFIRISVSYSCYIQPANKRSSYYFQTIKSYLHLPAAVCRHLTYHFCRHLVGFLLFLCLTIFTAMVIPRDGSSKSSRIATWGDLVGMANVTVALRHDALAACLLLPPSAAAAGLSEDSQQICSPPNISFSSSLSHLHHAIQIQVPTQ